MLEVIISCFFLAPSSDISYAFLTHTSYMRGVLTSAAAAATTAAAAAAGAATAAAAAAAVTATIMLERERESKSVKASFCAKVDARRKKKERQGGRKEGRKRVSFSLPSSSPLSYVCTRPILARTILCDIP